MKKFSLLWVIFSELIHLQLPGTALENLIWLNVPGKIRKIVNGVISDFMNLTSIINKDADEMGSLVLAFDPGIETYYVYQHCKVQSCRRNGQS